MKKTIWLIIGLLLLLSEGLVAQRTIQQYEYWFDKEYNEAARFTVSEQSALDIDRLITTTTLVNGIHTFSIRFQDNAGQWSSILSQLFYKVSETTILQRNIVAYEYWFDESFDEAVRFDLSDRLILDIDELISTTSLVNGIHTFSIRFLDNAGQWSGILSELFYKIAETTILQKQIIAYEYWLDDEYEHATFINNPGQEAIEVDEIVAASALVNGIHLFNIRFQDNYGMWSSILSEFFYKPPVSDVPVGENCIAGYRYWFDDDLQNQVYIQLPEPVERLELDEEISLVRIPKGKYEVNFQFLDVQNKWSSVLSEEIEKLLFPFADFAYELDTSCDSTVVSFTNHSVDCDTLAWSFGNEKIGAEEAPVCAYYTPGEYKVSLTVTDSLSGKESTQTLLLTIPDPDDSITIDASVSINEGTLTANLAPATAYQWLDCDKEYAEIAGETGQSFSPRSSGNYAVRVVQGNCEAISLCYSVTPTSMDKIDKHEQIKVYPNPTDKVLTVNLGTVRQTIQITLSDISGQIIRELIYQEKQHLVVEMNVSPGIYILSIETEAGRSTRKIVKR